MPSSCDICGFVKRSMHHCALRICHTCLGNVFRRQMASGVGKCFCPICFCDFTADEIRRIGSVSLETPTKTVTTPTVVVETEQLGSMACPVCRSSLDMAISNDDSTLANNIFNPSGRYSNMYADYNIDPENDLVYQNIIGRSLGDLYKGMGWDGVSISPTYFDTTFPIFNESATVKYTENDVDKFWLLSYKEAYNLFPTMSDSLWMNIYWLRSPCSRSGKGVFNCYVDSSGDLYYTNVVLSHVAARAAFKFSI